MKRIAVVLSLLSLSAIAAPPSTDIQNGVDARYYSFPYNPPVRDKKARTGPAFDDNGLNRAPLVITDGEGKPLTPDSKVLNRSDVKPGCGLAMIDGSPRVVGCRQ